MNQEAVVFITPALALNYLLIVRFLWAVATDQGLVHTDEVEAVTVIGEYLLPNGPDDLNLIIQEKDLGDRC